MSLTIQQGRRTSFMAYLLVQLRATALKRARWFVYISATSVSMATAQNGSVNKLWTDISTWETFNTFLLSSSSTIQRNTTYFGDSQSETPVVLDTIQPDITVTRDVRMENLGGKANRWRPDWVAVRNLNVQVKDASFVRTAIRTSDGRLPMAPRPIQRGGSDPFWRIRTKD